MLYRAGRAAAARLRTSAQGAAARQASGRAPVVDGLEDFLEYRKGLADGRRVGLVPTMGALHAGHVSLVHAARKECDVVVSTVFVNPAQFGPNEDFDRYPRTLDDDVAALTQAGADVVFAPATDAMYRKGHRTYVVPDDIEATCAEAARRPGFFRGVCTIVAKLFNIVQPDVAYFGQKDAMQCSIVRNMVADLNMPVRVEICPTVREEDGLAMSSRNVYLTPEERERAGVVYEGLLAGRTFFDGLAAGSTVESQGVRDRVAKVYGAEPMVREVEYISVADGDTFAEVEEVTRGSGAVVLSVALKVGAVRLIDNVVLQ